MMPVTFKAIKPGKFNDKAIKKLAIPIQETIEEADKLFARTYQSWKHKPKFEKELKITPSQIIGSTLTTDKGSKDNPYPFVTRGTKVRYAIMTRNFSPKSRVRVIGASAGRGGVLFVNKRKRRPGIKAREFEEAVSEVVIPKFPQRLQKAISEFTKDTGHAT